MPVAWISGPQLLDPPLWPAEETVDVEAIGVGRYLRRDPRSEPHQRLGQGLPQPEDPLEARKADLYALPLAALLGPVAHQQDAALGQSILQLLAPVGQVPEQPAPDLLPQTRLGEQLLRQAYLRSIRRRELVGDGLPRWRRTK